MPALRGDGVVAQPLSGCDVFVDADGNRVPAPRRADDAHGRDGLFPSPSMARRAAAGGLRVIMPHAGRIDAHTGLALPTSLESLQVEYISLLTTMQVNLRAANGRRSPAETVVMTSTLPARVRAGSGCRAPGTRRRAHDVAAGTMARRR